MKQASITVVSRRILLDPVAGADLGLTAAPLAPPRFQAFTSNNGQAVVTAVQGKVPWRVSVEQGAVPSAKT